MVAPPVGSGTPFPDPTVNPLRMESPDMKISVKALISAFKAFVLRDSHLLEVVRWKKCRGDEVLRLDYPLDSMSLVVDLGGYHGDFAARIHERYGARVLVFEPVRRFHDMCKHRFRDNPAVEVFQFGLSSASGEVSMILDDDGSSIVRRSRQSQSETVKLVEFRSFAEQRNIERIDLLKLNIEGGEYDVLPHLIDTRFIRNVENVQVQFHNFVEGAVRKRDEIRERLRETHVESWCYPFVWESWRRKGD
jgi:FkbM family methyltransferase